MTVAGQPLLMRQALSYLVLLRHAYLSVSSVTRTWQAHQITASCLYKLRKSAYDSYIAEMLLQVRKTFLTLKSGLRNKESRALSLRFGVLFLL